MQHTILLFDIDGTLVSAGGAGRAALDRAFEACCGRADACEGISFAGMTDPLILEAAIAAIGQRDTPELRAAILKYYTECLPDELARTAHRYRVLPGAKPLLDRLSTRADVALGLGTGNIEAGARAKLERGGLDGYFGFGGFGSDASARADVIAAGIRKACARLRVDRRACRVVIIGDTPRDVAAAHANGARAVAVTTGYHNADALRDAGADSIHDGLESAALERALFSP